MAAPLLLFRRKPRFLAFPIPPHCRTFIDISTINWVRDRALDHAVEKERNLQPLILLKNLIKSEPSKSLPLSVIVDKKSSLLIPYRPIEFIRKYPSVFVEFSPGGLAAVQPHVKLTDDVLSLDSDEQLMFASDSYRKDVADRLLKLLMLSRINKVPLSIINRFKWDLGLPNDYLETFVRDFPDYFSVKNDGFLELVCWSDELAVSVMEKKARKENVGGYRNGMALAFPMQYSRGFEMDKKFKKWVDDWQKLPYISPYENASHLGSSSVESDKWAAGLLHELLHILVPKKTDKEHLLCLGEYMGLRARFKRALLHHPGIFYLSSKIGMHTVVLREGYKRNLLVEGHVLMGMRSQYIHLMNTVKEVPKSNNKSQSVGSQQEKKQKTADSKPKESKEEEKETRVSDISDSEVDDMGNDDEEDEEEEEEESSTEVDTDNRRRINASAEVSFSRGTRGRNMSSGPRRSPRRNGEENTPVGEFSDRSRDSGWLRGSKRSELNLRKSDQSSEKVNFSRGSRRSDSRQEKPVREFSSNTRNNGRYGASKKLEPNGHNDKVRDRLSGRSKFSKPARNNEMPSPQDILRGKLLTETRGMGASQSSNISKRNRRSSPGMKKEST